MTTETNFERFRGSRTKKRERNDIKNKRTKRKYAVDDIYSSRPDFRVIALFHRRFSWQAGKNCGITEERYFSRLVSYVGQWNGSLLLLLDEPSPSSAICCCLRCLHCLSYLFHIRSKHRIFNISTYQRISFLFPSRCKYEISASVVFLSLLTIFLLLARTSKLLFLLLFSFTYVFYGILCIIHEKLLYCGYSTKSNSIKTFLYIITIIST